MFSQVWAFSTLGYRPQPLVLALAQQVWGNDVVTMVMVLVLVLVLVVMMMMMMMIVSNALP